MHLCARSAGRYNSSWTLPNGTKIELQYGDPRMACGAHMYSRDGREWTTSKYALYNNSITWANGTSVTLNCAPPSPPPLLLSCLANVRRESCIVKRCALQIERGRSS